MKIIHLLQEAGGLLQEAWRELPVSDLRNQILCLLEEFEMLQIGAAKRQDGQPVLVGVILDAAASYVDDVTKGPTPLSALLRDDPSLKKHLLDRAVQREVAAMLSWLSLYVQPDELHTAEQTSIESGQQTS